jgi:hypothetical protein
MPASKPRRSKARPTSQLTFAERLSIDKMIRMRKAAPTDALHKVNEKRRKQGIRPVGPDAVHRFAKGVTHKGKTEETRGRKRVLTRNHIRSLDAARKRLIKKSDNDYRVTYKDIVEEAGLEDVVCQRVCENALRKLGVSYKAPRRKIYITHTDAKARLDFAKKKYKLPASHWSDQVHAYVDNKAFPIPLSPKQRKRFRQTQITGHLRKPSEGLDQGFTKPRDQHSFLGIPSVNITAAVAKDKIILWHVNVKSWGGNTAAVMYKDHLKPALVRKYGALARFKIVEDGDRKGNYSNKGIAAKKEVKIHPVKLPPRTPSLMPLDYAIWHRIVTQLMEEAPGGTETKKQFLDRLRVIAKSLPKSYIKSVIAKMKPNLKALVDARGYTPKNDG